MQCALRLEYFTVGWNVVEGIVAIVDEVARVLRTVPGVADVNDVIETAVGGKEASHASSRGRSPSASSRGFPRGSATISSRSRAS